WHSAGTSRGRTGGRSGGPGWPRARPRFCELLGASRGPLAVPRLLRLSWCRHTHARARGRTANSTGRPRPPVRAGLALPAPRHVRTGTRQTVRPFTATVGHLRGGPHTAENFRKRFVCGREVCLDGGDVPASGDGVGLTASGVRLPSGSVRPHSPSVRAPRGPPAE